MFNNTNRNPGVQISSQTSNPITAYMRVFVGNLNTLQVTRDELRMQFAKYGYITAISVHRGYAFIQYNNPASARNAVDGENGSIIAGQQIDINIAAEPKPNQKPQGLNQGVGQNFSGPSFGGKEVQNGRVNQPRTRSTALQFGNNLYGQRGRGGAARGRGAGRGRGRGAMLPPKKIQAGRVAKTAVKKPMLRKTVTPAQVTAQNNSAVPAISIPTTIKLPDQTFKSELLELAQKLQALIDRLPDEKAEDEEIELLETEDQTEETTATETNTEVKTEAEAESG